MFKKVITPLALIGCCFAMDDDFRSRYLQENPGGSVMQRDLRLMATVEVLEANCSDIIGHKKTWPFTPPPSNYQELLTEPALTALKSCPESIRSILDSTKCRVALTFHIGGSASTPIFAITGVPVEDQNGMSSRCITIQDKNNLPTDIFW